MRIYVCVPEGMTLKCKTIREELHSVLVKYYGNFNISEIEFFAWNKNFVAVYVMERAKNAKNEDNIKSEIERVLKKYINNKNDFIDVKLNYQALNPDFRPEINKEILADKKMENQNKSEEFDYEQLSQNYQAYEPYYSFEQVILPDDVKDQIEDALAIIEYEPKVLDEWGLRNIIPYAVSAMSFYGPPGTGKTMAAEGIAKRLGKKIIRAAYADIESKFHGEGPKMVKAIFHAAERENAVLFLDESDSLLSKRLTNVTEGSSQAINSMRSQLLISLEHFNGIVIFATNLVINYDKAFLSRLISIEFKIPDFEARKAIWQNHIASDKIKIPLADDVRIEELAEKYEFCGRDIKKSVLDACVSCLRQGRDRVSQDDFLKACAKTQDTNEKLKLAEDYTDSRYKTRPPTENEIKAVQAAANKFANSQ